MKKKRRIFRLIPLIIPLLLFMRETPHFRRLKARTDRPPVLKLLIRPFQGPNLKPLIILCVLKTIFVEGMFEAGANGYAVKNSEAAELIRAVRLVAGGGTYLSPGLSSPTDPTGHAGS